MLFWFLPIDKKAIHIMWDFINKGINYTNYIDTLWISDVYIF